MRSTTVALRRCLRSGLLTLWMALSGCSVLDKPTRALVYDFGPGLRTSAPSAAAVSGSAVVLAEVTAPSALDSTAVLYRLAYANEQQLLPYAQARWSMPPAQLLQQRLRETLGLRHMVLREGDGVLAGAARPVVLQLELDEFSHMFDAPGTSVGLVRVHASVMQPSSSGDRLLARRDFIAQRAATSSDAAGGVRALAAASDSVLADIAQWLSDLR